MLYACVLQCICMCVCAHHIYVVPFENDDANGTRKIVCKSNARRALYAIHAHGKRMLVVLSSKLCARRKAAGKLALKSLC